MTFYRGTAVTSAVKARLELIVPSNGYRTSVGQTVFVAHLQGTPTDIPCVYLLPTAERGEVQYGAAQRERSYTVTCVANRRDTVIAGYSAGPQDEWVIVDAMIADVCTAMEAAGAFSSALVEHVTYEGSEPAYSEDGGELTGVKISYSIRFAIAKGDPDNAPT